jgi:hypothetical protein
LKIKHPVTLAPRQPKKGFTSGQVGAAVDSRNKGVTPKKKNRDPQIGDKNSIHFESRVTGWDEFLLIG